MTRKEKDRIECAIRHIQTAIDVDPWAQEIAMEAMNKRLPQNPMESIDSFNDNLVYLYCPSCGTWIGMRNKRLKMMDLHNNTNREICAKCGQVLDLEGIDVSDR